MDLGNPVETVVHLIGGIACLDRQDRFPMVNALVYVHDAHWTGPTVNRDARLSIVMIH